MKKTLTILAAMSVVASSQAVVFTQWNFNSSPADALTTTGSILPSVGAGVASTVGGVAATFASGSANGGSSDTATVDNTGWNISTWAAQGTGNGSRGVQFLVSTAGQQNIKIKFDQRASNTVARHFQVQYTTDGTSFGSVGLLNSGIFENTAGDTWFNGREVDLSGIAAANNNSNFGFRIVAVYAPSTSTYISASAGTSAAYATSGTSRFDMVTVDSEPVPEPASMIALAVGAMGVLARRKKA